MKLVVLFRLEQIHLITLNVLFVKKMKNIIKKRNDKSVQ